MTKPREKTREELTAEIEDSKKKIQQFENREKILRQKLSREERRERNHRLIVRGAIFESIVPEAKAMTDEEAAALLRLALTSQPAREYRALCRGLYLRTGNFPRAAIWRLCRRQGTLHFPCDSLRCLPFCVLAGSKHLALQAVHFRQV